MRARHHRRSLRLRGYDYASPGAYFVTLSTHDRACLFGDVVGGVMSMNDAGCIVADECHRTATIRNGVSMDQYVVMPNHFHGIVALRDGRGTARRAPTVERFAAPVAGSIPTIIRAFKSAVTKRINDLRGMPGASVWQRGYHEHIIRHEDEWHRVRRYVEENPTRWATDIENPAVRSPAQGDS